jgi:hypothetical protein
VAPVLAIGLSRLSARSFESSLRRPHITYASPPKPHRKSIETHSLFYTTKIPCYVYRPEDL